MASRLQQDNWTLSSGHSLSFPRRFSSCLSPIDGCGYFFDGASDHGVSEALYLRDPDDNGVELYADRPLDRWPRTPEGGITMFSRPLDLEDLLAEPEK